MNYDDICFTLKQSIPPYPHTFFSPAQGPFHQLTLINVSFIFRRDYKTSSMCTTIALCCTPTFSFTFDSNFQLIISILFCSTICSLIMLCISSTCRQKRVFRYILCMYNKKMVLCWRIYN